jgi:hypothetical protein
MKCWTLHLAELPYLAELQIQTVLYSRHSDLMPNESPEGYCNAHCHKHPSLNSAWSTKTLLNYALTEAVVETRREKADLLLAACDDRVVAARAGRT